MNTKKISILITASALAASSAAYANEVPSELPPELPSGANQPPSMNITLPFSDVSESDWFYDTVSKAYGMKLVTGVSETEFAPQKNVTGAELITMLFRADGNQDSGKQSENWYDEAISWAESNNILTADNGWNFEANTALSREQMMVIIYRYACYKGAASDELSDLEGYEDVSSISAYALDAVKWLVGAELIEGDGNLLHPSDALTRAETATILMRTLDLFMPAAPGGNMPGGNPPSGFGGSGTVTQGTSATTISENGEYSNETYESTGDNENALRVDGAEAALTQITVNKTAGNSSNTEDGDFYGQNAALLATDGANVIIKDSTVNSTVTNGNGIFSYGEGTTVTVSDTTITTTGDHSGGIHTTGGGVTNASNLTINTNGSSSAAIRTDRGGGIVTVNGGTYTTNGYNSPAVYSTADITVSDSTLTANNSEALIIEGKNSITLNNCVVSGNMSDTHGTSSAENVDNVMIYQSMSGDADVGTSTFTMTGGSLTGNNGDLFYVTNTHSIIKLSGVELINNDSDSYLLKVSGNSAKRGWGTAGANGAQVEFTADSQTLNGDISVDTISTLDMDLVNNSVFTGTINISENKENGAAVENNAVITIDESSVWTLTGDCTVTSLKNNGTINFNGYTITLADGTVLSS